MSVVTIIGSGMMGSALAFPARENGHEVRLVCTHLDREIIETCRATGRHPKFVKDFPAGLKYYEIEEVQTAIEGADLIIGGVSSFGVEWFAEKILPHLTEEEQAYYRRGKNSHTHAAPKSATPQEYAKATGFETLVGALYLLGRKDRLMELFAVCMEE